MFGMHSQAATNDSEIDRFAPIAPGPSLNPAPAHRRPRAAICLAAGGWLRAAPAKALSRIAQLDQRTALPDQCLHSAEADVRPPKEEVRI